MLKIHENILVSTIDLFNPIRTGESITSVQKLLQTAHEACLGDSEEQQLMGPGVTPQLREMLDLVVTLIVEKALTIDGKVRLGVHHKSFPINQLSE